MRDERDVICHLGSAHDRDYRLHGCVDIIFTAHAEDGTVSVDCEPDRIMVVSELVDVMRHAANEGSRVRDNTLHIVARNASLTYELDRLECGCWLGRKLHTPRSGPVVVNPV